MRYHQHAENTPAGFRCQYHQRVWLCGCGRCGPRSHQYADLNEGELKRKVEEIARHHIHEMYRYLDILSTISVATPLFGLLGTVLGMIDVFEQIYLAGVEDAPLLAGGFSQALGFTAAGLSVAIPALLFHRFFNAKIEGLVVLIDMNATKIIDSLR